MAYDVRAPWAEPVTDAPTGMTADDLARLPDDANRYELVEGRLIRMPPPKWKHGRLSMRLGMALAAFVESHGLGVVTGAETGFNLSPPGEPDTVLGADVAFVRSEHLPSPMSAEGEGYLHRAPDLVVEIASPSQHKPEMAAKARQWLRAGTPLLWLVWPSTRSVDVWQGGEPSSTPLMEDEVLDGLDVVPGFRYPIADLFRGL